MNNQNGPEFADAVTFEQWQDYFKIALGGTSSRTDGDPVATADAIAARAVALVQQRAARVRSGPAR